MTSYENKAVAIERTDLPAFYHTATIASGNAQNTYLALIKANVFLLALGAIFSAINPSGDLEPYRSFITYMSSIPLILSIFITVAIELSKYEKKWYDGRAIAESVKTMSWRFMMDSEPYNTLDNVDAEERFRQDLLAVKSARRSFGEMLGGNTATLQQITDKMRLLRKSDLETRKSTYQINRIQGQKRWYATKSQENKDNGEMYFWALIILQVIAIIRAIVVTNNPTITFNPTGVVTTIVAGTIAWMQVKQYKNLAESYGLTTQELGIIESKIISIKNNTEFAAFVVESETAISREHTLWLARRTSDA